MDPLFDLDLTAGGDADDGALFTTNVVNNLRRASPRLGAAGPLVRFLHPRGGGPVSAAMFGPGPREGTVAVSYRGELLLVDTATWTVTT